MAFVCEQKSKKHTQGEASTKCRLEKTRWVSIYKM